MCDACSIERQVLRTWTCGGCGFIMAAMHRDATNDSYTCPNCGHRDDMEADE